MSSIGLAKSQAKVLAFLRACSWLSFLHILVCMKSNMSLKTMLQELKDAHGTPASGAFACQKQYHAALQCLVNEENLNQVGGPGQHVAVDESGVGRLGYMPGKRPMRGGRRADEEASPH